MSQFFDYVLLSGGLKAQGYGVEEALQSILYSWLISTDFMLLHHLNSFNAHATILLLIFHIVLIGQMTNGKICWLQLSSNLFYLQPRLNCPDVSYRKFFLDDNFNSLKH